MKRLFLLFSVLTMTVVSNSVFAQFSKSQMIGEWERAKLYTREYLDAMPADGYGFKPTQEIRSFAGQMLHLADGNFFFTASATGKPSPMGQKSAEKEISPTKEATIKAVMESYDYVIATLRDMTEAQLQETAKLEGHEISKAAIFGKAFEHQTHHRGQTTIYLRLKGVKPPAEKLF